MARPVKKGLDYFPQDTDIHGDRKIRRLLNEFGAKGYLIYDYLKCSIYRQNGYWMPYDDEICFDVADFLKCGITEELVNDVIKGCVRYDLFDERLFNTSKILTSSGIQKRYSLAKRSGVIDEEMRVITVKTRVIAAETPVMDVKTPVIAAISTQSKVKEIKVNKSKVNISEDMTGETSSPSPSKDELLVAKKKKFGESLIPFVEEYGKDMIRMFYDYWSEPNKSRTKLKWELERTWEISLRLKTWRNNDDKWSKHDKSAAGKQEDVLSETVKRFQDKVLKQQNGGQH